MAAVKLDDKILDLAEPTTFPASRVPLERFGEVRYDHPADMDGYAGLCNSCGGELGDQMSADISSGRKR